MNTGFYKDLDTNFEIACKMSEQDFKHEELIEMLKNGNIPEKQIAAMKLSKVQSAEEAKILLNNLTGCDGKIREAVALKINQLINQDENLIPLFTQQENSPFADATIDINGNICRLIIDSVSILKQDEDFAKKYLGIVENSKEYEKQVDIKLLKEYLEELDERDKQIMIMRYGLYNTQEFTQKEVASLLGISQSYISRIEKKVISKLRLHLE